MSHKKLIFYIDGGSQGNPGESGAGVLVCDSNHKEIKALTKYIGIATNNVAEYTAFVTALKEAIKLGVKDIEIYSDSELLVRQVKGIYKVRDEKLKPFYDFYKDVAGHFTNFSIHHIVREKNYTADRLAAQAIREKK